MHVIGAGLQRRVAEEEHLVCMHGPAAVGSIKKPTTQRKDTEKITAMKLSE